MRLLLLCVLLLPASLEAGWKLVGQFNEVIGCGFFLDARHGFIGTGDFDDPIYDPKIWMTTDGGTTWRQCATPILNQRRGRVSSIFMKTSLIGYATINESYPLQALWKTTDGGLTWFDHTQGNEIGANCVYVTPYALVISGWSRFSGLQGGRSLDDGASYQFIFNFESNGIDFADDLQGVLTPGPNYSTWNVTRPCYFTTDGGRTWQQGGNISESWSVYAVKQTSTFIALPEGKAIDQQRDVMLTTNTGVSWRTQFAFRNGETFTGHIAGQGQRLYVQTDIDENSGLFRSDDLGLTWKNVGGPSHRRDTRFVVTGCDGEVVYAFNPLGEVWKTTDGGDGTLTGGNADNFTLSFDSLALTSVCTSVRDWLPISFAGCSDAIIIDALTIENDTASQFKVDTTSTNLLSAAGSTLRVPILYIPQAPGVQIVQLRIRAHTNSHSIDTTITITGRTVKLPAPYVPDIARGSAGDTVLIPIYLKPTSDPFSISDYEVYLRFNTDLLEPFGIDSGGTLTRMIRSSSFSPQPDGLKCRFTLWRAITESSELARPLVVIKAHVYLTSEASTTVTLDSFHTVSGVTRTLLLGCDPRTSSFTINLHCGDSSLLLFMKTGEVRIASIRPNPNAGNAFKIDIAMPARGDGVLEAVNSLGIASSRTYAGQLAEGMNTVTFKTEGLAAGLYYLQLTTPYGMVRSRPVIIAR